MLALARNTIKLGHKPDKGRREEAVLRASRSARDSILLFATLMFDATASAVLHHCVSWAVLAMLCCPRYALQLLHGVQQTAQTRDPNQKQADSSATSARHLTSIFVQIAILRRETINEKYIRTRCHQFRSLARGIVSGVSQMSLRARSH